MNPIKSLWNKIKQAMQQRSDVQNAKQEEADKYEALMAYNTGGQKKQRRPVRGTNYTPPKKKRK